MNVDGSLGMLNYLRKPLPISAPTCNDKFTAILFSLSLPALPRPNNIFHEFRIAEKHHICIIISVIEFMEKIAAEEDFFIDRLLLKKRKHFAKTVK